MSITNGIFDFIFNSLGNLAQFGSWLFEPLEYINMAPIALFSILGVSIILGFHLVRLFVGG